MTNKDIATKFALLYTSGKNSNCTMFIAGDTIYSYGYHFPIARMTNKWDEDGKRIVLFTSRTYSVTTARHKSHVYFALRDAYRIITVDDIAHPTIEELMEQCQKSAKKSLRARKQYAKEMHEADAIAYFRNAQTLATVQLA